jgi:hypothetical protein
MAHETFRVGDLEAVIGDNEAYGDHRAGYNGIHRLMHRTSTRTPIVPAFAGLNFEHIFDGSQEFLDRKILFEPRLAPMKFTRVSEDEAELYQEPTPTFHLESRTRFKFIPPHAIEFTFRCKPTQHVFSYGYIGLFWASYIHGPEDKSVYCRSKKRWQQLCTPAHDVTSTVVHAENKIDLRFREGTGSALFKSLSPLVFDEPFFYGLFDRHVFLLMFDRGESVRFSHSPNGAGDNAEAETSNPAWDFQFIIPSYEVLQDYGFRARLVFREACPRSEILSEVEAWRKSLGK